MYLSIAQILVSVVLVVLVLLQERSSGLSGIFGGEGEFYQQRRGFEKLLFIATIVFIVVFAALSLLNLVI